MSMLTKECGRDSTVPTFPGESVPVMFLDEPEMMPHRASKSFGLIEEADARRPRMARDDDDEDMDLDDDDDEDDFDDLDDEDDLDDTDDFEDDDDEEEFEDDE